MDFKQKQTIIKYYEEKRKLGRKFTQDELRLHFESVFTRKIGRSTICDILKNRNKIMAIDAKKKVRDRGAKYPQLEEALFIYYCEMRTYKAPICDELIREKAEYFAQMLCDENGIPLVNGKFKYSVHWLDNLKKRYDIGLKTLHGEGGSVDSSDL